MKQIDALTARYAISWMATNVLASSREVAGGYVGSHKAVKVLANLLGLENPDDVAYLTMKKQDLVDKLTPEWQELLLSAQAARQKLADTYEKHPATLISAAFDEARDDALELVNESIRRGDINSPAVNSETSLCITLARRLNNASRNLQNAERWFDIVFGKVNRTLNGAQSAAAASLLSTNYKWIPDGWQPSPIENLRADLDAALKNIPDEPDGAETKDAREILAAWNNFNDNRHRQRNVAPIEIEAIDIDRFAEEAIAEMRHAEVRHVRGL